MQELGLITREHQPDTTKAYVPTERGREPTEPDVIAEGSLAVLLWIRQGELTSTSVLSERALKITADGMGRGLIGRLFGFETTAA